MTFKHSFVNVFNASFLRKILARKKIDYIILVEKMNFILSANYGDAKRREEMLQKYTQILRVSVSIKIELAYF